MKKPILLLFGVFLLLMFNSKLLYAQALLGGDGQFDPPMELEAEDSNIPEGLNYQAVARDESGEILINQRIGIRIELLSGDDDNV